VGKRKVTKLIVHCSDSTFGDVDVIRSWHKEKGWRDVGYHYVIINGFVTGDMEYDPEQDGNIQPGRGCNEIGAHCKGHNKDSIGICLIGVRQFTEAQFRSLEMLIFELLNIYPDAAVFAHNEFNQHKTCPNMSGEWLRRKFIFNH